MATTDVYAVIEVKHFGGISQEKRQNYINKYSDYQQRDKGKRRRNLRNLSKESLKEDEEREEEKFSMKNTVKPREIEQETKHLFATV